MKDIYKHVSKAMKDASHDLDFDFDFLARIAIQSAIKLKLNSEWVSVVDSLPEENETVDVWMERGERLANAYYEIRETNLGKVPQWFFRNGFSVWKPLHNQDVSHWMPLPDSPVIEE